MDTKGIELTECNNCRFRAVVDGKEVTGRIEKPKTNFLLTGDDWFGCAVTPAELENLLRGAAFTIEDGHFYISGFEIVPRDPETYKDWQVGDIIGFENENGEIDFIPEHLCRVIFRCRELVAIAENCEDADINGVYTCGQIYREGWRLVLTDIEQQIIEDRKKAEWTPQDGDICYVKGAHGVEWVFIKNGREHRTASYVSMVLDNDSLDTVIAGEREIKELRPATDEEKQRLFDAMAKVGKRWTAEKKVVEDIPKLYEFKKGEPVLVRDDNTDVWRLGVFIQFTPTVWTLVTDGIRPLYWKQCIPYNEKTMHLLGTTEDYKEEQS